MQSVAAFLERAVDVSPEPLRERPCPELLEAWRAAGIAPGDLIVLALPTGAALLKHFFAVVAAGGVPALVAGARAR
jgi:non-ribosomal peptide synthetase component E (peptide arylation enzyme)